MTIRRSDVNKTLYGNDFEDYFQKVYTKYFDRLFGYALVITKSENLAKDVVSEVFFNLWNTGRDLRIIKELKAYLFTSVKNQAIRSLSNDPVHFHSDYYEDAINAIDNVNPEELLVGRELEQFIGDIIDNLPPQCGLVFRLVKEKHMKYDEVASELGIGKDTVKYHVKTALHKIRTNLAERYETPSILKWISAGCLTLVVTQLLLQLFEY